MPWLGLIVIAILVIIGIGLLTFAVVYSQGESENRAINGTVAAVVAFTRTPTQTRPPTNTPLPSDTPTATVPPTNTEPAAATPTSPAPTAAATATSRPIQVAIPTDTPPPPPPTNTPVPVSAHGITGGLALCDPSKTSYAARAQTSLGEIERVCIIETIQNHNGQVVTYGILGVSAQNTSGGPSQFQSSWRGDLSINGNCTGPSGNGGCGGSHTDTGFFIDQPGSYVLTLRICYSGVDTCLGNSGDWETLTSGIPIQIISWTPSP